jgi:hypothetical protein
MPNSTFVEIPEEEQAQILAALRRAVRLPWVEIQRRWAASAACMPHRAVAHAPAVAPGPAQGAPAGVWEVPHVLERCHASPAPAGHTSPDSLRGDRAAMGP